jgi:hypothetical protein
MAVLRGRVKAVRLLRLVDMRFTGNMIMTEFVPHFAADDYSLFNGDNQVMTCSPKMGADGLAVISSYRNLHMNLSNFSM